jgi:hypothetical protein
VAVDLKLPKNESAQLSNWTEQKASDIQTAALVLQDIKLLDPSKGFSFTILVSQPNAESAQPPLAVGELGPFSLSLERHEKGPGGKPSMEFPLSDFLPALKNLTSEGLERGLRVTFEPAYTPGATDLVEIGAVKVDVEARAE